MDKEVVIFHSSTGNCIYRFCLLESSSEIQVSGGFCVLGEDIDLDLDIETMYIHRC